ncbi:MAG: inositol monophosphatase [Rhodospirillales bacterium]|jgi:fructose-1,6-bisphosphatase/inositol monophosphatase family enzyme|nr:inositol monophosphatase [Rhodospirillales bacterium]
MDLPYCTCKALVLKALNAYAAFMKIPGTDINTQSISTIIIETADSEIMPLFQALGEDDIREKSQGELVTIADIAAEKELSRRFMDVLPGSAVLGEESFADDPALMELAASQGPVWIIDPIDGTKNFSKGKSCFAVMVAFLNQGKVQAGWIYDPIARKTCYAVAGEGAWCDGKRLTVAGAGQAIDQLQGSLGNKMGKRLGEVIDAGEHPHPVQVQRYRCCGREYMDLALGKLQFLQYAFHLKPWDHAPGVLIAREAGYFDGFFEDASHYDATQGVPDGYLMIAPDKAAWQTLRNLLWD